MNWTTAVGRVGYVAIVGDILCPRRKYVVSSGIVQPAHAGRFSARFDGTPISYSLNSSIDDMIQLSSIENIVLLTQTRLCVDFDIDLSGQATKAHGKIVKKNPSRIRLRFE